jgi:thiamine kinase-like enzyme
MHNGYQIDPQSLMLQTLFDLKESNGRIEQRLEDGKEFHHEVRETLKEHKRSLESHGRQLVVLRKQADQERKSSSSTILQWLEVFQRLWPLLFLITTLAGAIGVHVPGWLKELSTHSVSD